jgi:hypothetical protein
VQSVATLTNHDLTRPPTPIDHVEDVSKQPLTARKQIAVTPRCQPRSKCCVTASTNFCALNGLSQTAQARYLLGMANPP